MSDMPRTDPERPDPKLERTIASWLRDEPIAYPTTSSRVRSRARARAASGCRGRHGGTSAGWRQQRNPWWQARP